VDPEFKTRMIESYEDCSTLAQSIPLSLLRKQPMAARFGRQACFFACARVSPKRVTCQHIHGVYTTVFTISIGRLTVNFLNEFSPPQ